MQLKINRYVQKIFQTFQQVKKTQWGLLIVGLVVSTQIMAQTPSDYNSSIQHVEEIKNTKGKGWQLSTKGGLKYINPQDETYWFAIGGLIRLDQVFFSGSANDKQGQFRNCGFIRRIEPGIDGGMGKDWEFSANFAFTSFGNSGAINGLAATIQDTWIGYTGFSDNSELFFGRLSGNWFGLEGSTGGSWMAFMERSAQANLFYPGDGVGIMGDMWWKDGAVTVLVLGRDQGANLNFDSRTFHNDRLRGIVRATYAPLHCPGDVWHFGVSSAYHSFESTTDRGPTITRFGGLAPGGVRQRSTVPASGLLTPGPMMASYASEWNAEMARQIGPFMAEAEYTEFFVHRVGNAQGVIRFTGWNLQTRFMLTGEAHSYDVRDGSFGSVDINSPCGALELAVRYDYVNLNDKNFHGGSQHDFTTGLNWFINPQLRFTANYVRSVFRPSNQSLRRGLDVFGMRLQYKFK